MDKVYARQIESDSIRQLQVPEQMCKLTAALELLEKQLAELESRLSTVVRQEVVPPSVNEAERKAIELVPHAESLRQRVWHVEKLQNVVSGMLQRIEI